MGIYIPQCALKKTYGVDANVNFLNKQCHDGVCWCVNAQGEITNGTMTLGLLHCDTDGRWRNEKCSSMSDMQLP